MSSGTLKRQICRLPFFFNSDRDFERRRAEEGGRGKGERHCNY